MKKIFITGAGGFIGGRLVEVLKETSTPEINILLRNVAKAARISRYPVHFFRGSTSNEEIIRSAMTGCDVAVHCAHDFANPLVNLQAAEIIAKQCLENGVQKLIYLSSFAVHRTDTSDRFDEESPLNDKSAYAVNKLSVEKKLLGFYQQSGLPVIILRPTIVYGPFSTSWTAHTVIQMLENRVVVPFCGKRICNAVYIDDVVSSITKAMQSPPGCNGKIFLVSGDEELSWKEYYDAHLQYRGTNIPVYIDDNTSQEYYVTLNTHQTKKSATSPLRDPISFLKKTPVYRIYQRLLKNPTIRKKLLNAKGTLPRPLVYPSKEAFDTLSCKGLADISRIKNEMDFQPAFSFRKGMEKTLTWIDWANLKYN